MSNPALGSKVSIPRLVRRDGDKFLQDRVDMPRTQNACDNCRRRKVRCGGEKPQCQSCAAQCTPCAYPQARKDRLKDATERVSQSFALLRDLRVQVDDVAQQKIDDLLGLISDNVSSPSVSTESPRKRSKRMQAPGEESRNEPHRGEADDTGSGGSNDDLDLVDEDLFRSRESRATGFMGKNSEVQWLRSLRTKMEDAGPGAKPNKLPYISRGKGCSNEAGTPRADASRARQKSSQAGRILRVSDSTFYLDDDDHLEVDVFVDPYEVPPPDVAESLFDCYIQTVHTSFPILPENFQEQFYKYNESIKCSRPYQVPKDWQAMLNLVFAIGAQHSHLIQAKWQADERGHLIYMNRAIQMLGLDKLATSFPAPTLTSIQAIGLLSVYYLTIGQVSRAWMMVGISLRFALAVGLHLRNDDPSAFPSKRERMVRTWWSLHSIESLLCTFVGRPCVIPNDQLTVPLPSVLPERQFQDSSRRGHSNSEVQTSSLRARATIGLIVQKALSRLYSPRTTMDSWEQIQNEIGSLSKELDEWATVALPKRTRPAYPNRKVNAERERLLLSFQYHSTKLLIYRPCLCRIERHIENQTQASADFNQNAAEACIQAAQAVTSLFPAEPDLVFIYQQSPWWCIVHNIMQAIAVFLLKLSFEETHETHSNENLLESIKKLVRWLRLMSVSNVVARRAYEVVVDITNTSALRLRFDKFDILGEEKVYIGQHDSFQFYQSSDNNAVPVFDPGFSAQAEWQMSSSISPTVTADSGTQYPTTTWEPHTVQDFEGLQPDQYLMLEPDPQIPLAFGNPFYTNFDFLSPPYDGVTLDKDTTIDGA